MTTETAMSDLPDAAHRALAQHAWPEALDLFDRADKEVELSGRDLEKMAEAAWFVGKGDLVIEAKERAFKAYTSGGDRVRAAFMAIDLSREYTFKGQGSIASAWVRRGERLLEGEPESYAHGYLALNQADTFRSTGQVEVAMELAERAIRIGSRAGDADLEALALVTLGMIKIATGEVVSGFQLLEEAAVAATNGELSPFTTGVTYCQMISACRDLADYARAGEWTHATERWCARQSISGFPGICRVHRAEVVALSGAWAQAEVELERATKELADYNATPPMADGFYALARIRFRKGDLEAAEETLRQAHALGHTSQPLLALIRLAQGKVHTAANAIKLALEEQTWDQWARAHLLPAQIEIAVAAGDLAMARAAAEEYTNLVETYDALAMMAERDLGWGRVLLAEGDPAGAARHLRKAKEGWGGVMAPYEVALSRILLARALRAVHDEDQADLELEAAHKELSALGAIRDAEVAAREITAAGERRAGPIQARKTFMFTDIVGSTNLAELLGDLAWDQLLQWHDETLREEFVRRGGEVVNSTGDGFFVAFESVGQGIECAVSVQRRLAEHRRTTGFAPMVRIGLHAAEANRHGTDYSGMGVHVAARVAALAMGGEILITAETLGEAGEWPVSERREVSLKGVTAPVEITTIDWG